MYNYSRYQAVKQLTLKFKAPSQKKHNISGLSVSLFNLGLPKKQARPSRLLLVSLADRQGNITCLCSDERCKVSSISRCLPPTTPLHVANGCPWHWSFVGQESTAAMSSYISDLQAMAYIQSFRHASWVRVKKGCVIDWKEIETPSKKTKTWRLDLKFRFD